MLGMEWRIDNTTVNTVLDSCVISTSSSIISGFARAKFYKSFNEIFGKVGRVASESVIMQLISSKCPPLLSYSISGL